MTLAGKCARGGQLCDREELDSSVRPPLLQKDVWLHSRPRSSLLLPPASTSCCLV